MTDSKFMFGSPVLMGDNTVPGLNLPQKLKDILPKIFKAVTDFGCDYYPTVVQKLTYDEISEIAAYSGFPVRYPHWKFGMEYEEMQRRYEHGMHRIYELVINTNPCYIYLLDSNTLVDDVTVVAHALGHCDFFKNNIYFSPTSQNMMNELANHGIRIRRYMSRWGKEKVTDFINHVLRIETLIDPAKAWKHKRVKNPIVKDFREYKHPGRMKVAEGHDYMDEYVNPKEWIDKQHKRIERDEASQYLDIFSNPTKDIMGFIRDHAPLKPWQSDILAMLYKETMYFAPQRITKTLNEGFASFVDYNIIAKQGFASLGQETDSSGIIDYAQHKMGVLGGKYSLNPYKLGFCLFMDIEERWNKGQFGPEWDECTDIKERKNWDKKLGKGLEKVFEVRKYYNDVTALTEFFTHDFCEKYEFFEWKKYPNGETKIESRDYKKIKKKLIQSRINGGLPEIVLVDPNYKGKGILFLQHTWDGMTLYPPFTKAVLQSLQYLWKNDVLLATKNRDGKEFVYVCTGEEVTAVAADEMM
jgi:stage V sporulation protein R